MTAITTGADHGAGRAPSWTWRRQFRQQLQPRLTPLLALLVCCWLLVIGMTVPDRGARGHDHGHHGLEHPGAAALLTVTLTWQLMTLAMMGPSCLPAARHVAMNTLTPARTVPAFLLGYLLLWGGYLATIAVGDATLHRVVGTDGRFADDAAAVLPVAVLLAAAAWQLTPIKRACLRHCRSGRVLPARGRRADLGALRFGARHGLACVGSCGPMMLVMLTVSGWQLLWMAGLGWLIWLEKTRWLGRRLAVPSAASLALLSVLLPVLST